LDETADGRELPAEAAIAPADKLKPLTDETNELISVFVAIVTKVKQRITNRMDFVSSFILHPSSLTHGDQPSTTKLQH
jgi:hypothetical protein